MHSLIVITKIVGKFAQLGLSSTLSNAVARMIKIALCNLTSIYRVRYFEGDVPNEEQGDLARHTDVPFQPDVQNHATSQTDHFTKTPMMPTSTFDFFSTNLSMLNMVEGQT